MDVSDSGVFSEIVTVGDLLGKWAAPMATVTTALGIVFGPLALVLNTAIDSVMSLFDTIDTSVFDHCDFSTIEMISTVNSIFPVDEFITFAYAYFTAWVILLVIRWIKSVIPTVAN